jgi:hypothetical protein
LSELFEFSHHSFKILELGGNRSEIVLGKIRVFKEG